MSRATRTFKLRVSPAGLDVLIASHCLLVRDSRMLLAWGTTLHVAVEHLWTCPVSSVRESLDVVRRHALCGDKEHHLGAPHRLGALAGEIAARVSRDEAEQQSPRNGALYLAALYQLRVDSYTDRMAALERVRTAIERSC